MIGSRSKQLLVNLLFIALLASLAMASSFYRGITTGNDFRQHFQFAQTIHGSLVSGEIYPGFAAEPNYGLGDVALRFYPPFTYYLLSVIYMIVGNWYAAALFSFWLVFFVGGAGVYLLAREEFPSNQALLAAAIYIFAPYHLNEIYNNFLLAEFVATAVLPFCLLYITRVCRAGGWRNAAGLAISYALLVLSHLPMLVIGSLVFVVYAAFLLEREKIIRELRDLSLAVAGGLLLSSFYWIRMVRELGWIKHSSPAYFTENFAFDRNFLLKPANWINFNDDILNLWLADLMLVAMLALLVPSVLYIFKHRRNLSRFTKANTAILLLAVFMTTPLSTPLWHYLAFLQKVQFPWRWMAIISLCGAVFASIGISGMAEAMKAGKSILLPVSLGCILLIFVFTAAFIIKQASYVPASDFNMQIANIAQVPSYEGWWPVWAKESAQANKERVSAPGRDVNIGAWESTEKQFTVSPGEGAAARVRTFYYPHWKASVNNSLVQLSPDADGVISLPLPPENASVRIYFEEPLVNRAAFYASAAAWVILLTGLALFATGLKNRLFASGPKQI
jgi:uncharacterized membrane protein